MEYIKYQDKMQAFGRLLKIMDELREQCPWDRKQTWESLRNLSIEEMYEFIRIRFSRFGGVIMADRAVAVARSVNRFRGCEVESVGLT